MKTNYLNENQEQMTNIYVKQCHCSIQNFLMITLFENDHILNEDDL
jgi:hypothetical protein